MADHEEHELRVVEAIRLSAPHMFLHAHCSCERWSWQGGTCRECLDRAHADHVAGERAAGADHLAQVPDQISHPDDVIRELCKLQAEVADRIHHYVHAADCFCGDRQDWVERNWWQNDGESLRFIIEATRKAMAVEGA